MPAMTSPFSALRFSGRLMVIQSACPRFSVITAVVSVMARSLPWALRFAAICGSSGGRCKGNLRRGAALAPRHKLVRRSKCARSGRDRFPDPDLVVVESGSADWRDRVRARQHVDAAVTDMILVGMNRLRDQHAAPHALEQRGNQRRLA